MKARASKGFHKEPLARPNIDAARRLEWLRAAKSGFVQPSAANREIYGLILDALWPDGHGIPGPILSEDEVRAVIDAHRAAVGKQNYKDVFRRFRELQGEEGFTSIVKEGTRYQLQSLDVGPKREPRAKPDRKEWQAIKEKFGFKCAHCGAAEPDVKLSPDHRRPRARGGGNEVGNWQPLCEQCNNLKSSQCQGCNLNCYVCSWAFPETYKPIKVDDNNKEQLRRQAEKEGVHQSELANRILAAYFNKNR